VNSVFSQETGKVRAVACRQAAAERLNGDNVAAIIGHIQIPVPKRFLSVLPADNIPTAPEIHPV
jgi:hypothetical protein